MRDKTRKCTGNVHFCSPEEVGSWLAAMLHLDCSWRGCKDEAQACLIGGQDSSRREVCVCVLSCPFVAFLFLLLYSSVSCLPFPQMRLLKRNRARKRGNCLVLTEISLPASETQLGITRNGTHLAQTSGWRLFFCWNQAALLQRTLHGAAHINSRTYTYTDDLAYVCNAPL